MAKNTLKQRVLQLMNAYHRYAGLQLPIYDYSFYEHCRDGGDVDKELTGALRSVLDAYIKGEQPATLISDLKQLRATVIEKMEAVSAYTDSFTIYEYILNRMELRFSGEDKAIDDEAEANDLCKRIFSGDDKTAVNLKVQLLLSQLPVRMTRAKFMDMVENSLKLYENGTQEAVEKFLYLLRSAAGVYQPARKAEFEDLAEAEQLFSNAVYKTMEETEYMELSDRMEDVVSELNERSDYYTGLQEVINQLYLMLITEPYASEKAREDAARLRLISQFLNEQYQMKSEEELPDELLGRFSYAEGKLESLSQQLSQGEALRSELLDYSAQELKKEGLEACAEDLELCAALTSASLFMNPDEEDHIEPADGAFIREATKLFQEELSERLESREMPHKRAIMAAVLKELPVFFGSGEELREYVRYSLENCRDYSEKRISLDLLRDNLEELEETK